jgi:DNA-directed RNA polymerase specialized sigma24 family protein
MRASGWQQNAATEPSNYLWMVCFFTSEGKASEVVSLDEALLSLAKVNPMGCQAVEMQYFGGLPYDEIAAVLGIGTATITRHWRSARAWLYHKLSRTNM